MRSAGDLCHLSLCELARLLAFVQDIVDEEVADFGKHIRASSQSAAILECSLTALLPFP